MLVHPRLILTSRYGTASTISNEPTMYRKAPKRRDFQPNILALILLVIAELLGTVGKKTIILAYEIVQMLDRNLIVSFQMQKVQPESLQLSRCLYHTRSSCNSEWIIKTGRYYLSVNVMDWCPFKCLILVEQNKSEQIICILHCRQPSFTGVPKTFMTKPPFSSPSRKTWWTLDFQVVKLT